MNNAAVDTEGDPLRMKQILLNLLGNGIKFTPEGGQVGLEVENGTDDGLLVFRVWDTGPGIDSTSASTFSNPSCKRMVNTTEPSRERDWDFPCTSPRPIA